ncbi:RNA polymerase sigma factor [Microbacterium sp. Ag1]|uniref:RNA polymerase sigma factor n=1 Tax=Microbacterium sp. Ag1 TaxID=1643443 RepID=UPI0006296883|nr:sigma-70 family RNA polymerase sigma factor [Microbacterium sp. Ag1]KKX96846.1 hypothetical protein AAY78_16240 [Microbacterium sp. Ag1]
MSTDSEIIQRSLGQPRAFAELFDRHAETVGGYAARRLGPDAGEDILSETFLVAEISTRELAPMIASLSAKDRETLLLYAWGDLTYEEIAIALGVPVGTVRSRMNRIRTRLDPARPSGRRRVVNEQEGEVDGRFRASA